MQGMYYCLAMLKVWLWTKIVPTNPCIQDPWDKPRKIPALYMKNSGLSACIMPLLGNISYDVPANQS